MCVRVCTLHGFGNTFCRTENPLAMAIQYGKRQIWPSPIACYSLYLTLSLSLSLRRPPCHRDPIQFSLAGFHVLPRLSLAFNLIFCPFLSPLAQLGYYIIAHRTFRMVRNAQRFLLLLFYYVIRLPMPLPIPLQGYCVPIFLSTIRMDNVSGLGCSGAKQPHRKIGPAACVGMGCGA